jgi:hypothetical protein
MRFLSSFRVSLLLTCLAGAPNVFADYITFRGVVDTINGPNAAGVRIGDPVSGSLVFTATRFWRACGLISDRVCSDTGGIPEYAVVVKEQFDTPYGPADTGFIDGRSVFFDEHGNLTAAGAAAPGFAFGTSRWGAKASSHYFPELNPLLADDTWIIGPVTEFTHVSTPEPGTFGSGALALICAGVYLFRKRKLSSYRSL